MTSKSKAAIKQMWHKVQVWSPIWYASSMLTGKKCYRKRFWDNVTIKITGLFCYGHQTANSVKKFTTQKKTVKGHRLTGSHTWSFIMSNIMVEESTALLRERQMNE